MINTQIIEEITCKNCDAPVEDIRIPGTDETIGLTWFGSDKKAAAV